MSTTYKTHVLYTSSHNLSVVTCLLWWQHNNSPVSHTHQPQLPVSSQQITDYYSLNTLAWELVFTIHCCLILRHQRPVWLCSGLKTIINDNWLKTDNQTKHVSDLTDELFKILLQYEQWWTMINLLWQCHVKHQKEVYWEIYFKSEPTSDSLVTLTVLCLMSDLTCDRGDVHWWRVVSWLTAVTGPSSAPPHLNTPTQGAPHYRVKIWKCEGGTIQH